MDRPGPVHKGIERYTCLRRLAPNSVQYTTSVRHHSEISESSSTPAQQVLGAPRSYLILNNFTLFSQKIIRNVRSSGASAFICAICCAPRHFGPSPT